MIKIEVDNNRALDLEAELKIDRNDMNREVCEQASKYIYWAAMAETAEADVRRIKLEVDIGMANQDKVEREKITAAGKKPTENSVMQAIKRTLWYKDIYNNLSEAKRRAGILRAAEKAFHSRKDLLNTLSYLMGREYGNDGKIKQAQASTNPQ